MAIESIEDLRAHLALATRVELSTIPPYLYAMYSIRDQDSDAAKLIASVVVEEMLHVCLTANLLLAIGGEPHFGDEAVPRYPAPLAHHVPPLNLELRGCTVDLVRDTFMVIEKPQAPGAPPEDDNYETLGQFYAALEASLDRLGEDTDLFANHQPERQLSDRSFYGTIKFDADDSGGLTLIHNTARAKEALEVIMHQGEGVTDEKWADPEHRELTHFYKFEKIASGETLIGPVWPVLANPRASDMPESVRDLAVLANAIYGLLFVTMGELFGESSDKAPTVDRLYTLMTGCLEPVARYLVAQPVGGGLNAGPPFEVHRFTGEPWEEAATLAERVGQQHPDMAAVAARMETLRLPRAG